MYKSVLIMLAVSMLMACSISKHVASNAKPAIWQTQPITIDGDSKDWPSPYPSYDSKALIAYAASNDKDNLYITIETGDEMTQMKILKAGLTVWIDTTGRKEEHMGIQYPMANDQNPFDIEAHKGGEGRGSAKADEYHMRDLQMKIKRAVDDATQMTIEGFNHCNGGYLVTQKNDCGITVRIGIDEYKELIWEAAIPFKAIYGKDQIDATYAGKPVSVCYYIKGFKHTAKTKGGDASNLNMDNGGMGGMNGGMGGGMHTGGTPVSNPMLESTHTWQQFTLAYQQ